MNTKNYRHWWVVLFLCQVVLLSGCTSALWDKERFARYHWPANPPNLRLFYSEPSQDLLAEYDEASQGTATVQRRAYWLEPNAAAIAAERQPRFVSSTNCHGLAVVPVTGNPTNPPPEAYRGLYAVVSTNGLWFRLHSGPEQSTVYKLPMYFTSSGQRVKQVLLTPFTVVADVTVVGGVVAIGGGAILGLAACQAEADWGRNEQVRRATSP
jgi:hypothetical protein